MYNKPVRCVSIELHAQRSIGRGMSRSGAKDFPAYDFTGERLRRMFEGRSQHDCVPETICCSSTARRSAPSPRMHPTPRPRAPARERRRSSASEIFRIGFMSSLAIMGRYGPSDRARAFASDGEINRGLGDESAFRKCSKYRNAVFALFAAPRGSQDRVVRNAGQARLLELFADAPTQFAFGSTACPGTPSG